MDVVQLRPRLWRWSLPHPDWEPDDAEGGEGWQEEVASYALVAENELVLFDPLVPPAGTDDAERYWHALDDDVRHHGPPRVLITIHWHCRSSQAILDRYEGTRVFVGEGRAHRIEDRVAYTDLFAVGDALPGGVVAKDADRGGEVAFWLPSHGALLFGDVVLGADGGGARLCPAGWYEPTPREELVAVLRPLLDLPIEALLLAHGEAILEHAKEALERALR
ncbi:MAG TPA: MBL fold metallo-hydrolase [Gaiellaceae bacterium]|nr:MBL fold metallo-hydrolase [Gaiellaceae bacterium]